MEAENYTARQALTTYLSSQLQSGLVSLEAAIQAHDTKLVHQAAKNYFTISELAKDFYSRTGVINSESPKSSHSWGILLLAVQNFSNVECTRKRRLARVSGDEFQQKAVITDIINSLNYSDKIYVNFSQRGESLIMRCSIAQILPRQLIIAGQKNALLAAAREPSVESIEGYLVSQKCQAANIKLRVTGSRLFIYFHLARQLRMPLSD